MNDIKRDIPYFDDKDFEKKNEMSKVKIDGIKSMGKDLAEQVAKNIVGGKFNLELEKLAKEIVEKQDNAKAMEFTKVIGTMLRENGVAPILTEYKNETTTENSYKCQCGYAVESLDFTEHDKVFEDEIKNFQEQIAKMEGKRQYLRTRCMEDVRDAFDRGDYGALTIIGRRIECEEENKSLKQRIAELETENDKYVEMIKGITGNTYEEIKGNMKIHESGNSDCVKDLPFDPMETANYLINSTYKRETSSIERSFAKLPDIVDSDRYTIDDLEQITEHLLVYCKHNKEVEE